jgi:hypothetical protein
MLALLFVVTLVCTTPLVYLILRTALDSDWSALLAVAGTWAWVWFLAQSFLVLSW